MVVGITENYKEYIRESSSCFSEKREGLAHTCLLVFNRTSNTEKRDP